MKNTPTLAALIFPALVATIGIKTIFEVDYFVVERAEIRTVDINKVFAGTSFNFVPSAAHGDFIGTNEACVVIAGPSNRDGDSDAIFLKQYEPSGAQILYLYKDEITSNPPYLRAQLDNYIQRLRVAIGQKPVPKLMFHLAVSSACKPSHFRPIEFNAD